MTIKIIVFGNEAKRFLLWLLLFSPSYAIHEILINPNTEIFISKGMLSLVQQTNSFSCLNKCQLTFAKVEDQAFMHSL